MNTPICDFVQSYIEKQALRLHMPGHKGQPILGPEPFDITEIDGADSLYEAEGIIRESEQNAGSLFGADTFYSAEGSSLSIRAMLYLAALFAKKQGKKPLIAAGRNAHKAFLSAVALLDLEVLWLCPSTADSYLSCPLRAEELDAELSGAKEAPAAVYLTCPDYLGNTVDLAAIAQVCRRHGVLLLVDNAHGAYFKFLQPSRHPMDLGADLCCDSAHKTLPVLTGGGYLHISKHADPLFSAHAKQALALFGSTSPSYLILQSLDKANAALCGDYPERLEKFCKEAERLKAALTQHGYPLQGNEPLKVTVRTKPYGYRGTELARLVAERGLICEFADPDFLVLMLSPELSSEELQQIREVLCSIPPRTPLHELSPDFHLPEAVLSVREAMLSACERIPVSESEGRILSAATVGCPPAVPILISGERINKESIDCFQYYSIAYCTVVSE